jgi:predicted small lipoprotein YifL
MGMTFFIINMFRKRGRLKNRQLTCLLILFVFALPACGRKLQPLPPVADDPVVIQSVTTDGAAIVIKARVNADDADITLLGKAQGICPQCEDDLIKKNTIHTPKGTVILRDEKPEDPCMVYRILLEKGDVKWSTPARVYCK